MIQINISNKMLYTLVACAILLVFSTGFFVVASNNPNPGHSISEVSGLGDDLSNLQNKINNLEGNIGWIEDCEFRLYGRDRDDKDRYSPWVSIKEGETVKTRTNPRWGRYLRYMELQIRC